MPSGSDIKKHIIEHEILGIPSKTGITDLIQEAFNEILVDDNNSEIVVDDNLGNIVTKR